MYIIYSFLFICLFALIAMILYCFYHWFLMCYYLKFLSIGELVKVNWDLRNKYEALSKKERYYFGWILIRMIKKIEAKQQDLVDKI